MTTPEWQSYREPVRSVILRTGAIAVLAGAALATFSGRFAAGLWPLFWLSGLPSVDIGSRYGSSTGCGPPFVLKRAQRIRCALARAWRAGRDSRIGVVIAGVGLVIAMRLSLLALVRLRLPHWHVWWLGGFAFVVLELVAHLVLQLRGRPNFYYGLWLALVS